MADLFSRVANDPISLGVVNGLFESIILGKQQAKKEQLEAAKIAQEKKKDGITLFTNTATKSSENAYNVLTSPNFTNYLKFVAKENPHAFAAISAVAMGDRGFPEDVKTILESARGSSTFAMNYIEENGFDLKQRYPKAFNILKTYASMQTLNEGENRILGNLKDKSQVQSYIESTFPVVKIVEGSNAQGMDIAGGDKKFQYNIRGGNANKSALFWTLQGMANAKEPTGPTIDDVKAMLTAAEPKNKLAVLNYVKDKLTFKEEDGVKVYDNPELLLFIDAVRQSYAGQKKGSDVEVWKQSIAEAYKLVGGEKTKLGSEKERGSVASKFMSENVDLLKAMKLGEIRKLEKKENKTSEDIKLLNQYNTIKTLAKSFDNADKKANASDFSFTSTVNGKSSMRDLMPSGFDGKSLTTPKGSIAFLSKLNSTADFQSFYNGLTDDKKMELQGHITKAFQIVHEDKIGRKTQTVVGGLDTKTIREPAYDFFNTSFSNNLANIDFIKNFITNGLGLPLPLENNSSNPPPLDNQENVPEGSVRIGGTIYKLASETIEFAKNNGYSQNPSGLFRDVSFPLRASAGFENQNGELVGTDKNIVIAHKIQKAGLVHPSAEPTTKEINKITRVLITNRVENADQMFEIIKMSQSPDISHLLPNKKPYEATLSPKELNRVMLGLTNFKYDLKGVTKQANANDQFLQFLTAAKATIAERNTDSPDFLNNLYSAGLKLFMVEGSVFDVSKDNFTNMISNFIGHDGDSAADIALQTKSIQEEVENFRRTNFGMQNDKLASIYISLAYNYAKTLDPSGRISDADFRAAMNAIRGSMLNTQTMSLGILDFFEDKAEVDSVFLRNVSKGMLRLEQGNFVIDKDTIRSLKAVGVFRQVKNVQANYQQVKDYIKMFDQSGGGFMGSNTNVENSKFRDKYELKLITDGSFPRRPPTFMVRFAGGLNQQVGGSQMPLYVSQQGKVLTVREIQQRQNAPRGS